MDEKEMNGKLTCVYCLRDDLTAGSHDFKDRDKNNYIRNLATVDHIYPLSLGGPKYDKKNCCVACKRCNETKGNKVTQ